MDEKLSERVQEVVDGYDNCYKEREALEKQVKELKEQNTRVINRNIELDSKADQQAERIEALRDCLGKARCGIQWEIDTYPERDHRANDEMIQEIDELLKMKALEKMAEEKDANYIKAVITGMQFNPLDKMYQSSVQSFADTGKISGSFYLRLKELLKQKELDENS